MILSDQTIKELILSKKLIVESEYGLDDILSNIACASLDIRLWNYFKFFPKNDSKILNIDNIDLEEKYIPDWEYLVLQPGDFCLGATKERFGIPEDIVARVEWRSSIWRLWILIHVTAWFIDPWFGLNSPSTITLEIKNINTVPVALKVGSRVCQLALEKMDRPAQMPYNKKPSAKYNWQIKPEISNIYKDLNKNLDKLKSS
jgi:dCTP deaminase